MTSKLDKVKETLATFEKAKAEMLETAKANFKDCAQEIFNEHPILKSFSWTQYTPYFNDGDACEFSVHTDYPRIKFYGENGDLGQYIHLRDITTLQPDNEAKTKTLEFLNEQIDELEDDDNDDDDEFCNWTAKQKLKNNEELTDQEKAGLAVQEFLRLFDEDVLYDMFNDHVKVTVTRDGVEVEEYSHE